MQSWDLKSVDRKTENHDLFKQKELVFSFCMGKQF